MFDEEEDIFDDSHPYLKFMKHSDVTTICFECEGPIPAGCIIHMCGNVQADLDQVDNFRDGNDSYIIFRKAWNYHPVRLARKNDEGQWDEIMEYDD